MRMKGLVLALALSMCMAAVAGAAAGPLPQIVVTGLDRYKADGAEAAVRAWMLNSPNERSEQTRDAIRSLREFENVYGQYRGYQVVRIVTISPTCQMCYVQLDYEKGPAFGKLLVYQAPLRMVAVNLTFSTNPEKIWAFSLFALPDEP